MSRFRFVAGAAAVWAAAAFLAVPLRAQSDLGSIQGYVRDPSGATIPNAKVTVNNETGLERVSTTNESGRYVITNIPPGFYRVSVTATGFKKYESSGNKLDPSAALALDMSLTIGAANESVVVTANSAALQTESAAIQKVVTRQQIDSLELNGRNPIFMANLVPGTRGGNLSALSFSFSQGPNNINGARTQDSLITFDGAPAVRTRSNGTSLGSADVDSTSEIQILTSNYAAEYGRSSGGQIRILTKTGTNEFHGAAYEYLRNTAFNANTWTRNNTLGQGFVPPFHYNQFGYNAGGPFYIPGRLNRDKNKFFWYWGQEWVRNRYLDTNSMTVPSMAMRQGDFSELLNPTNVYYGKVVQIKDPTTGNPFPNNVIPTNRLSPSGVGILSEFPKPNLTVPINTNQFWYAALPHPQDQRKDTLAADMNLTDTQRIQFRRMNYAFNEYQPLDGGTPFTPKYFNRPNQTNSVNYVWTISPTMVNEFLATVSLDDVYIPVDTANFLDRTTIGINYPYIFPQGKLIPTRIPTVNMTGFSGVSGGPYPSHSTGPIYTLSDSFTWIKGNHTLKFGFSFERSGENDNDEINVSACPTCTNNQNGQFSFTDTRSGQPTSGNAAANAALGLFDTYSELGQRAYTIFRGNMYEGFAQDRWKVNQKLTVDLGMRYTVVVPFHAQWGNMIVFDPSLYDPAQAVQVDPKTGAVVPGSGDRYNGMVIPGNGWPDSAAGRFPEANDPQYAYLFRNGVSSDHYSDVRWNQWQPRVGIAYALNPKTVLRAGAGRFFTKLGVSDSIFLGGNPPFQPTANVSFGSVDNPGGTQANSLPLTVTTQSKAFKNPESWEWNFTVERDFFWKSVVSVGYVGRRGLHLQREANINQPTVATVLANPGVNLDALRPYAGYNSIRESDNVASSMYNSLQLSWNRRFANGFSFGAAYTYSKSMDDGSAQRDIIPDTYDAHNLWGLSDFDVTHILIVNYLYELPFFRDQSKLSGKLLGGWQLSGISQFQTGTPCSVAKGNDYAGVGQDGSMSCAGQFWNMNGSPTVVGQFAANGSSDPNQWFSVTNSNGSPIFTAPSAGTFNTTQAVRNIIHNPGLQNWNIGLFKRFSVTEKTGFQFRAEAFNAFNHPNLGGANFDPTSASFGKVTGKTGDVRNLQLSLRFFF
ncbi:TonB-dependent receptor [Paludibaculum fermentans]|uniref:Carboxypeptidase regulatory-like domain-containing protein n=1 Tax=Paludibaculum fermentans TaxID=1473598 RepID=A0A7S7NUA0_PALFE|nr:carboxypeptidase regulatory-like domain-containing protein [Paludibaculum fermentans]QOY89863.1 carboxypeptidase regulatory-like domain-containing protein [Paludibaculum fermentans]